MSTRKLRSSGSASAVQSPTRVLKPTPKALASNIHKRSSAGSVSAAQSPDRGLKPSPRALASDIDVSFKMTEPIPVTHLPQSHADLFSYEPAKRMSRRTINSLVSDSFTNLRSTIDEGYEALQQQRTAAAELDSRSPSPDLEDSPPSPKPSGIRLRINFKQGKIQVVEPKKPNANAPEAGRIASARIAGYTDDEVEVALTLAGLRAGARPAKKLKMSDNDEDLQSISTVPTIEHDDEATTSNDAEASSSGPTAASGPVATQAVLKAPTISRKRRIVDENDPADQALIAAATKAGSEVYDSDAEDLPEAPKRSSKKKSKTDGLFRNVAWGPWAMDETNDGDFPTEPEFTQFVPGRWERMDDGSVRDQKFKLVIKLTNPDGKKLIFRNQPPKDWTNQEAITALNKRSSQQVRRNTAVRFRPVVEAYVQQERQWILNNLVEGKPSVHWKDFVAEFNVMFAGKTLYPGQGPRPIRTHSSLSKEIERFGKDFYAKGLLPVAKDGKRKREDDEE